MAYLRVHSKTISLDIEFKDKYIFIIGDSGVGKSLIVDTLGDEESSARNVDTDLQIKILNKSTLSDFNYWNNGELIVSDEIYARKVLNQLKDKNCYVLIITRKIFTNLNFSYRCIYTAERINGVTQINQSYELKNIQSLDRYEVVILEDSGYAKTFITECLGDTQEIISSGGKSNITNMLKDKQNIRDTMLLIFDGGGIGSDISKILNRVKSIRKLGVVVHFLAPECFEHVLLCSGYLQYDTDIFKYFSIQFDNTESFCEYELARITENSVIECSHDKCHMSDCWYKQCNACEKNQTCSFAVNGDKFNFILAGGPMRLLLKLRNALKEDTK